jgi:hypothetical protein
VPFWPGGLDAAARDPGGVDAYITGEKGLRTVAPGLSRGLRLPGETLDDDFVDVADYAGQTTTISNVSCYRTFRLDSFDILSRIIRTSCGPTESSTVLRILMSSFQYL